MNAATENHVRVVKTFMYSTVAWRFEETWNDGALH